MLIFDAKLIAHFNKTDPSIVSTEAICNGFMFLWNYIKHVVFLPGHVNHWITISELGNLSMMSLPREQVMAFGDVCAANMMYLLYRSFYLNASWGQNVAFKMVSAFLDPVIKAKIVLTSESTHPGIFELFHPC